MRLVSIAIIIYILNIPFGYWRENVKKFSMQWVLAIHVPIPIIVILRIFSGIGFKFITYPVLVGAFFLGQYTGARLYRWRVKKEILVISGCLMMDLYRSRK
jgi:hypothetical protein